MIFYQERFDKVTKWFASEESLINNSDKMVELYDLRDFLLNNRTDIFYWELASSVESDIRTKSKSPPFAGET